ncbi:MAG: acyl-CoA thioesterase/BAAT N-terminal domain-containing protein [Blastocatellia bacterium]|nr:acyl-CoA thioesterase/BAAT N-terminal domain-containing protein [Blastocatellia bacterium]
MKKIMPSLILAIFLTALAFAVGTGSKAAPAIHVSPDTALMDEVVSTRVTGLSPDQAFKIIATMPGMHGETWKSEAEFTADKRGAVDLGKRAPSSGSYTGVDAMGLFWSMKTVEGTGGDHSARPSPLAPVVMNFDLEIAGKPVAEARLTRLFVAPGVRSLDVRDDGLVAKLYEPEKGGPHPGVLVLGGSEGGIQSAESGAALLASRGYAALAVAYFGMEGLPQRLVEVPVEYLKKAIDWMRARDTISSERLAVLGGSKGGELALLLAAKFPELKAVVAYVPSNVVWQGIGGGGSSWSEGGKPLDYVPYASMPPSRNAKNQMIIAPLYLASLDNKEAVEKAAIPVEKINGPVLVISGKGDELWPSSVMADMVIARLKERKHKHRYEHLSYESAGHAIGRPYRPTTTSMGTGTLALGGTAEANARAQADSWPKVLRFLNDNLMKRGKGMSREID